MYPLRLITRRHPIALILLAAVFSIAGRLSATTYFIDYASGSDAGSGVSNSSPWRHCPGDPAATGSAASATLAAGDSVTFKGGVTYVLTGASGIALRWNGSSAARITYDGNSAGTWGSGRARFTDNHGGNGIAAFSATNAAAYLTFTSLEFSGIGGASALPVDTGSPASPRDGAGIVFSAGVSNATITGCVFNDLGYWFNQRPMNAASISGRGVSFANGDSVTISSCDFAQVGSAIEMSQATTLSNITITDCTFHDSIVWTVDLPAPSVTPFNLVISGCTETNTAQFGSSQWLGYGPSPRTTVCSVNASDTVILGASAAAVPTASFSWRKNGTTIAGATSSTLTIAAATSADAGTYTVYAVNSAGSALSNDAVVSVAAPTTPSGASAPVITTQPVNQTGAPWSTATFTVAASGSPAPTYQWLKNGSPISGWTNATLTLIALSPNDTATYCAVATNSAGSVTSNPATLTVTTSATPPPPTTVAPAITTQPISVTAMAQASATFSVAASGTPATTYQWYRNGTAVNGATNATLSFSSLSTADAGTYTATATNSAGSATSNPATLTVTPLPVPTTIAPVITTQPVSQTGAPWGTATFTVAASGSPAPTYQWLKNGTPISGWTNATLTLTALSTNDSATYTAVATNSAGSATSNPATLTVTTSTITPPPPTTTPTAIAPVITTQPVNQTGSPWGTATFTVAASGTPAPTYQWKKNGTPIAGWTNATLTLTALTTNDNGTYTAVATNSAGSVTSNPATLTVTTSTTPPPTPTAVAPVITKQPVSRTVTRLSTVTFTVAASGTPAPTYQWRKNGKAIAGWTNATLTLTSVTGNDNATYTAVATNSAGSATSNGAVLTVTTSKTTAASEVEIDPATPDSRLSNLSVRAVAGRGNETLIVGFVVAGQDSKSLLVRGVGPTLSGFGLDGWLPDPTLALYTGSSLLESNFRWASSANAANVAETSRTVGAFALGDTGADAALLPTLGEGAYTAHISSSTTDRGLALVELYDAQPATDSRLVNVSVRANVQEGAGSPIIGFVVSGSQPKQLLVRAIGPGLAGFGVDGTVSDPRIEIFRDGVSVGSNDNWAGDPDVAAAGTRVGAFPLQQSDSKDAAMLFTAEPGAYSAVVTGVNGAAGAVMFEVYEIR